MTQAAIGRGQIDQQTTDRECVNHQYKSEKELLLTFRYQMITIEEYHIDFRDKNFDNLSGMHKISEKDAILKTTKTGNGKFEQLCTY